MQICIFFNHIFINKSLDFCFLIKVNFFLWQKFSNCGINSLLRQEVSFCDKTFFLMPRNFFLWQEISASDKNLLPVTWNYFHWQENISCMSKSNLRQNSLNCCKNFVGAWLPGSWGISHPERECLWGVKRVSGSCLEGVWMVSEWLECV